MAKRLLTVLLGFLPLGIYAQFEADALRFSQWFNAGAARFTAMGGAFGALGGDFTALSHNPGGLGVYQGSELTLTPSFRHSGITSRYTTGAATDRSQTQLSLDNLGLVTSLSTLSPDQEGLLFVNIGLGYNRLNHFTATDWAQGPSTTNSILDFFASRAHGTPSGTMTIGNDYDPFRESPAPWEAIMAWNTFLIDTAYQDGQYWPALNQGDGVNQQLTRSFTGGIGEYVLSLGVNFSHRLYLGMTIGIQDISFRSTITHTESAFGTNQPLGRVNDQFYSMEYIQTVDMEGTGYNVKLGGILRPTNLLRLGLALHTPTYQRVQEVYNAWLSSVMLSDRYSAATPTNQYDFRVATPFRMIGSAAVTFGTLGLISVDAEYVDYRTIRLSDAGDGYQFHAENQSIDQTLRAALNLRGGAEVWISDLALRAGYAWFGSPYAPGHINASAHVSVVSGGLGYRLGNFFMDGAYQLMMSRDYHYLYNPNLVVNHTPVSRDVRQGRFLLTLGVRF